MNKSKKFKFCIHSVPHFYPRRIRKNAAKNRTTSKRVKMDNKSIISGPKWFMACGPNYAIFVLATIHTGMLLGKQ